MIDNREDWQIATASDVRFAITYLNHHDLNDQQRKHYEVIYKTGDLTQWINERVKQIINRVNLTVAQHEQVCVVQNVAAHWHGVLRDMELSGTVVLADGIRIEGAR